DMFNEDTNAGNDLVLGFLFGAEFLISGFFLWLISTDMVGFKSLEACILKEDTARRKCILFLITNTFVVHTSSKRPTEIAHETLFNVNNEVVLHGMRFFFTAIVLFLLDRILWTLDTTFRAINDEIHCDTERQRLFQILRVPFG